MEPRSPELHFYGSGDDSQHPLQDHQPIRIRCMPVEGAIAASLSVGDEELGSPSTRLGEHSWEWEWNPRGRAGAFAVRLTVHRVAAPEQVYEVSLAVTPGKVEQAGYEQLLTAIQRAAAGLVYALEGGTTGVCPGGPAEGPTTLIEEYWTRLVTETRSAGDIVRALSRGPSGIMHFHEQEQPIAELTEPGPHILARIAERPLDQITVAADSPLNRLVPGSTRGAARLPRAVRTRRVVISNDRYEHRLLARMLRELVSRCIQLREMLTREISWRSQGQSGDAATVVPSLQRWRDHLDVLVRRLVRYRDADFLQGVPASVAWHGPSEGMRRDPRYRQIARLWRLLHERPFVAMHSPAFDLPVNDVPTLYEQWCLLVVARVLQSCGSVVEQNILEREEIGHLEQPVAIWRVRLAENHPLLQIKRADGKELALWYRRRYKPDAGYGSRLGSLDPFLRIPDIVIEVNSAESPPAVLVFDAKYRVSPRGGIPEDALADAYSYHQALGYGGVRASRGAFLLFPGETGFVAGDVGAVALVPGQTTGVAELLRQRLAAM